MREHKVRVCESVGVREHKVCESMRVEDVRCVCVCVCVCVYMQEEQRRCYTLYGLAQLHCSLHITVRSLSSLDPRLQTNPSADHFQYVAI